MNSVIEIKNKNFLQAVTGKENIELQELQKKIVDTVQKNKEKHDLMHLVNILSIVYFKMFAKYRE